MNCGTLVGEGRQNQSANNVNAADTKMDSAATAINTLELRRTTKGSMVRFNFTDFAVSKSGDVLSRLIGNELSLRRKGQVVEEEISQPLLTGLTEPSGDDVIDAEGTAIDVDVDEGKATPGITAQTEENPDRAHLRQIFFQDGEKFVLDDLRLKASKQVDAARRLVYLLLYAHELEGHRQVAREDVNYALKDVGLYEPHIVTWISTTADLREEIVKDGSGAEKYTVRLRRTGREEAQRILHQMLDPDVPNTWELSNRARTRSRDTSSDSSSTDKQIKPVARVRGRKANAEVDSWVTNWNGLGLSVDGHTICNDRKVSQVNKGLLGLWAIRKATSDAVKVVSGADLVSFINKAFVAKLDRSNLTRALKSKDSKGKVIRRPNGYEITPTGMAEVEKMVGMIQTAEASKAKSTAKKKS